MNEKEMANITEEANEARLSTLAAEINTIKTQTQRIMMQAAVEIGRRLVEAKGAVGHGGWGLWLEHNVDYSERTAQNLIRIFQEYGEGQQNLFGGENPQAYADLTYTQAVALLGIKNPDERAEFVENHDVANMTSRELADAIKERDEARAALAEEKEARERAEAETKDLKENIDELERDLKEAQETAGGEPDEETKQRIETIEQEKAALEAKLKAAKKEKFDAGLERDGLLEKNIGLEKELGKTKEAVDALKEKILELSRQPADAGKAAFAANFELAKYAVNGMMEAVAKIEEGQEKYREAVVKMLEAMIATVKEG